MLDLCLSVQGLALINVLARLVVGELLKYFAAGKLRVEILSP